MKTAVQGNSKYGEMAQLMMQNEKLHRKVKKAQQRRDHYASLYYRTLAELDETKWELTMARNKIKEMRVQASSSEPVKMIPPPQRPNGSTKHHLHPHSSHLHFSHPHGVYPHMLHGHIPHSHHSILQHPSFHGSHVPTSKSGHHTHISTTIPESISERAPVHHSLSQGSGSDSNTTSPDSGASFSPGIEPLNIVSQQFTRSKTMPNISQVTHQPSSSSSSATVLGTVDHSLPPHREAWSDKQQTSAQAYPSKLYSPPDEAKHHRQPPHPHGDTDASSPSARHQPAFHVTANHRGTYEYALRQTHPSFHPAHGEQPVPPHPAYLKTRTLSQDAFISSPLNLRRPAFDRSVGHAYQNPSTGYSDSLRAQTRRPGFTRAARSQDDMHMLGCDPTAVEFSGAHGLKKPLPQRPSPSQAPPHMFSSLHQAPPPSSLPPHYQRPRSHTLPRRMPTSAAPNHHPGAMRPQHLIIPPSDACSVSSSDVCSSPSAFSRVSMTTDSTNCSNVSTPASHLSSMALVVVETGEQEARRKEKRPRAEGEECCYSNLSGVEMLDVLARISDPKCRISKLEVSRSKLGQPEAMKVFCKDLVKNNSIVELSLPDNGISHESLILLLDCVEHCSNIRELSLRNNLIGKESTNMIKAFLIKAGTDLDSLVLTGNDIEQCAHQLGAPNDFTVEYDTAEGSEDSGLVVVEGDHDHLGCSQDQALLAMQYLQLCNQAS